MSKKRSLAYLIFLFFTVSIQAQQKISLESLIPPAPNAVEMGKYATYPVGTLTGIPEISFPLYEINTGKLKLPISLSYHASGIQVNQKSTDAGLGWSLNAGGQISRTVYGTADNNPNGYFNYTPPSYTALLGINNFYTMQLYSNPGYDLEPDLFVYSVGERSGKFICDKNKNFKTIPFDPIKIQKFAQGGSNILFQLIDDNGNIYKFDQYSNTISNFSSLKNTISTWYLTAMISADLTDTIRFVYEASYLEDIMEQQSYPIGMKMKMQQGGGTAYNGYPYFSSGADPSGVVIKTQSVNGYNELLLKQVKFKDGYVQFNRNTVRKDVNQITSNNCKSLDEMLVYNSAGQVIKKVTFNHNNFISTDFMDNWAYYRHKLTGFIESDPGMVIKKEYKFDYNSTPLPPYGSYNMDYWGFYNGALNSSDLIPVSTVFANDLNSCTAADGSNYTNGLVSATDSWVVGSANREPSESHMKAGMLNKITYPTGGYTQFEFEPHQYVSDEYIKQSITKGGATSGISKFTKSTSSFSFTFPSGAGLTLVNAPFITTNLNINFSASNMGNTEMGETQFVTLTNATTNTIIKTWKHQGDLMVPQNVSEPITLYSGQNYILKNEVYGNSAVTINSVVNWSENTTQHPVKTGGGLRVKWIKRYAGESVLSGEENYGYGIGENGLGVKLFDERNFYRNYEDVVSAYYVAGSVACQWTGTFWQRNFLGISKYNCINYMGSPILYSSVTKYMGNPTSNIGKTVSNYNILSDPLSPPAEFVNSGNYGSVNNAWKTAELMDETIYKSSGGQYLPVSKSQYEYSSYNQSMETGIQVRQYKQLVKLSDCPTSPAGPDGSSRMGNGFFSIYEYPVKTGASRRTKETKIIYDQQNGSNSISNVITTQYQNLDNLYPTEQSISTSDGINNKKISRLKYPQDMADPVSIAMVSKNILTPPLEEKTYKSIAGAETLLSTIQTNYKQIGNLIVRDKIKASTGNLIPEIKILFNQYDAYGNILEQQKKDDIKQSVLWGYNNQYPIAQAVNTSFTDIFHTSFEDASGNGAIGDSKTGKRSRTGTYIKSLAGLTNGQYILSYWIKSGGTWNLQTSKVTVNSNTYIISLTGQVDEIRFYPLVARMTTNTYEPLIGMTSQSDANNRITYYEYDAFHRLILIRDQNRNILQQYCYSYTGQPQNCSIVYNVVKSGTYTRNCSSGYTGSSVTYMVPAGTFSSSTQASADQLAQNDVIANGQAYANTNGTCSANCSFTPNAGFNISSSGISSSGGTVSFNLVFNSTSGATNWYNINPVATMNGMCKPSATTVFTMTESGRTWQINITSLGVFSVQLVSGTTPTGTILIALTGGSFNP